MRLHLEAGNGLQRCCMHEISLRFENHLEIALNYVKCNQNFPKIALCVQPFA